MQNLIISIQLVAKEIGKDQFWDLRNSLLKEKEQMQIQAQNLMVLGTKLEETVNNYKMSENKLINNKTDTKATSDDIVSTSSSLETFDKKVAGLVDDIDALVGYKGDIYSKSMGLDDIRSDIAAVNIYSRMLESSDGDAEKGLSRLEKEIDATSAGTWYLSGDYAGEGGEGHYPGYGYLQYGYDEYGGYSKYGDSNKKTVSDCKEEFLNYIQTESGIQ